MTFLYPSFLWSFFVLVIPIIIHLFNFRRYKTVYFSNLNLLRNVEQETKSRSRIKQWLILLSRLIILSALILAFAQPVIINKNQASEKDELISIYVDNSFSMDAEGKRGKLIEVAKSRINSIINAYRPNTKYLLFTNDLLNKHQHPLSKEQIAEYVGEIETSPNILSLSNIFNRNNSLIKQFAPKKRSTIYLISDFQKHTSNIDQLAIDSGIQVNLIPVYPEQFNNLFIDSIWFDSPVHKYEQTENLYVQVINNSDENYQNIPVNLFINDSLKTFASFNISRNSTEIIVLNYTNTDKGINNGRIEITDYPITYDNNFYFSYPILNLINVLIINQESENKYLNALFKNDDYISVKQASISSINYTNIKNTNTIIINSVDSFTSGFNQEIMNFIANGGSVLFLPALNGSVNSYNKFLSNFGADRITGQDTSLVEISEWNKENQLYKNVFRKIDKNAEYPYLKFYYKYYSTVNSQTEYILSDRKGQYIFSLVNYKQGKLFYTAFPFEDRITNFMGHPFFIPTVYNIILNSSPKNKEYYTIGLRNKAQLSGIKYDIKHSYSLSDQEGNSFYPDYSFTNNTFYLTSPQQIKTAGNYILKSEENISSSISFNYNRNESILEYIKEEKLLNSFSERFANCQLLNVSDQFLTKQIENIEKGIPLWKYFIVLAILFLLIEVLLIRLL